ncbi:MAG: NADH-quinone oxidoreductase subunit C [Acidobacteriota bacterium]|nr:NADH-quinone oxidoreductase subunit C [Acidobacteriota bacterium]MDE3169713.1 NADH-quinone oxidoreductase subunit C [Acidobacteriota bacterium]
MQLEAGTNEKNLAVQKLREREPQTIAEVIESRGETTVVMARRDLIRVCQFLAQDQSLAFTFLSDISAVDRFPIEPRFEINYHLLSMQRRERVRIKVRVAGSDAVLPSVTGIWPTANWHEREIFDLFGIRFEGHPDLTRILMPDDWEGHPLRKDYPVEGYR